ncbi:MAG TPA: 2-succinyl-5-enolpyruvyl-6-hydroxy-3-cyclohexene-1-carboxylic-acid synthase [Mycobacteriales bacterium]|jgi:2-succinyl-5-enolpyruvyl-6-hydroxy-3-cyclohexene-1-carboxylate synthase|nr:2-succinyl-5-enolpyruvyl-6-hydroxy-3-cyclohexene-1-carboxylic-acid synthase [Mycobacteriales bacterium]
MADNIARNAGHAFALVLVDELARHGVTDAVLAPGSRSTPIALALAGDTRIRLHVRIDERSASYVALGIARTTGRPVPVLCTSGTATAHFHGAVMEADQSRVPLLVLTADRPPELRGVGANQTVDQIGVYGTATRWSVDVGVPEPRPDSVRYWRSLTSRAVAVALGQSGGPAGPVHLNLPLREPLTPDDDGVGFDWPLDGRADGAPWSIAARGDAGAPAELVALLEGSERGVAVAGDGLDARDVDGLLRFCADSGWPLLAEPHSNARRAGALRAVDALLSDPRFVESHRPDLVVVAGRAGLTRPFLGWLANQPHVVVDRDGAWADPTRSAAAVLGTAPAALATCSAKAEAGWADSWHAAGVAAGRAIDDVLDRSGLTEPRVARDLAASLPAGGALVVASSMPIRDLDLTMQPRDGLRIVANRGVSGIDGFISTAVGVALSHDGPTVALAGDLSLLHDGNGLLADPRPDLTIVVVNNDGGGIFSLLPQAGGDDAATFERLFGTPHGVDVGQLAAAYGVRHSRISTPAALTEAVTARPDGIHLVEVRTDRAANAELHRQLRAAAAAALR